MIPLDVLFFNTIASPELLKIICFEINSWTTSIDVTEKAKKERWDSVYNQYEEERRIFYVACTRAKKALFIGYCGAPSPFLGVKGDKTYKSDAQRKALKRWRYLESQERGMPAYRVFSDSVLEQLLELQPNSTDELYSVSGLGRAKIEEFGSDMLQVLHRA
mgnify:CR=1 FL=1